MTLNFLDLPFREMCNDPKAMLVTHEKLKGIVTTYVFDHIELVLASYSKHGH